MATLVLNCKLSFRGGHIDDVLVHKSNRRQGIGIELMRRLIAEARRLDLHYVELTSNPKRRMIHS